MKSIPHSLKTWFVIHFIVDFLFAIPLIFAPLWLMGLFGFITVETLMARLVGAALIGIGGTSFLARNKGVESYKTLLSLKLLWSSAAIIAILIAIWDGAPQASWIILAFFAVFFMIWAYYKRRL